MKTRYEFKLISSCIPIVKGGQLIKDSYNVGGIKNSYSVYKIYYIVLFNKYEIILRRRLLGNQAFLRPYKTVWNKRVNRLPKVYWGKDSLFINMWLVLLHDYNMLSNKSILMYNDTTQSATVKIFDAVFESKLIKKSLKTNISFSINQKI